MAKKKIRTENLVPDEIEVDSPTAKKDKALSQLKDISFWVRKAATKTANLDDQGSAYYRSLVSQVGVSFEEVSVSPWISTGQASITSNSKISFYKHGVVPGLENTALYCGSLKLAYYCNIFAGAGTFTLQLVSLLSAPVQMVVRQETLAAVTVLDYTRNYNVDNVVLSSFDGLISGGSTVTMWWHFVGKRITW